MDAENFPFSTDKRPVCAMAKEMPLLLILARKYLSLLPSKLRFYLYNPAHIFIVNV